MVSIMEISKINEQLEELKTLLLANKKEVLNIDELCQLTGLTKSTIYKKTHKGQIPHYKKAKHLFFDRAEIIDWLKSERGFNTDEINQKAATSVTLRQRGQHV